MILRIFLILAAIFLLFYFLVAARKRPTQKIGITLTFSLIILFAFDPELSTMVAKLVGVGRGVDLIFYLSSMVLFFLTFSLYLGQRELRDQVTDLARTTSLGNARPGTAAQGSTDADLGVSRDRIFIVVPAYHEADVIEQVVADVQAHFSEVVVIDDGSKDGTWEALKRTGAHALQHPVNLGQGAALQTGFDYALGKGAEVIVTFDGDGQHRIEDVEALIRKLHESGADVALGSRFLGGTEGMPWQRRLLLRGAVWFTRWVGGVKVSDSHNGLRAFRAEALGNLRITQNRMAHASELLHKLVTCDLRFVEVPVTIRYTERSLEKGQSGLGAINILFDLAIKRFFGS